jgi:iron-sulfur cluster assembly accessory protein
MSFTITPAAERFIRRMMRFESRPGSGFRLAVSPGGCSGLAAMFDVAPAPAADEKPGTGNGLTFVLSAETRLLLDQVTIDFVDTPSQTGFVFNDPKQGSCGCSSDETLVQIDTPAEA